MWRDLFVEQIPLAEKVIRTIGVYALLTVLFRLTGIRGLAAMNTFDFIVIFLLSNVVQKVLVVQRRAESRHRQRQFATRRDGRCGDPRRGERGCQSAHHNQPDRGLYSFAMARYTKM
jgi:hypothetical protein